MAPTSTVTGGAPILSLGAGTSSVGVGVGGSVVSLGLGGSSPGLGVGGLGRVASAAATLTSAAPDNVITSLTTATQTAVMPPDNVEPTSSNSQAVTFTEAKTSAPRTSSGPVATPSVAAPIDTLATLTNIPAISGNSTPNVGNSATMSPDDVVSAGNGPDTSVINAATPSNSQEISEDGIANSEDSTVSSVGSMTVPLNNAATPGNSIETSATTSANNVADVGLLNDINNATPVSPISSSSQADSETGTLLSAATPNDSTALSTGSTVISGASLDSPESSDAASNNNPAQSTSTSGATPAASTVTISLPLSLSPSDTIDTLLQNPTNGIKTIWTIITTTVGPTVSDQPVNGGESTIFPSSSGADTVISPSGTNGPVEGGQSTNASPISDAGTGVSNDGSSSSATGGPVAPSGVIPGTNANTNGGNSPTAPTEEGTSGDSTVVSLSPSAGASTVVISTPIPIFNPSTISSAVFSAPSSFSNSTVTMGGRTTASIGGNSSLSADISSEGPPAMSQLTLVENGQTITLTAVAATSGSPDGALPLSSSASTARGKV
ncbi:hypothetical protein MMC34_004976 [Xylographa carneopallida]|nr:hypothetical protein [Xylographa carneopallida]